MNLISRIIPMRAAAALLVVLFSATPAFAFISEPETLVYGRIINQQNPNSEQLIQEGELLWTILKPDGSTVLLSGQIDDLDGGNQSYLLRIPHQALVLGQQADPRSVPLGITKSLAAHISITVDGYPAEILTPATSVFDLDQLLRADATRIDLSIIAPLEDTDKDGIPDWWEDGHGLDKQNPNDALADGNSDGVNNLAHYRSGSDPQRDSTEPRLLTREVIAYSGSTSIMLLEVEDSDSSPAQLRFTLNSLPRGGSLKLRNATANPSDGSMTLTAGSNFTQADVAAGRLIFVSANGELPGPFDLSVVDEDPSHAADTGAVMILSFDPSSEGIAASAEESLRHQSHRLAREFDHLIADLGATPGRHKLSAPSAGKTPEAYADQVEQYGAEPPHILLGGASGDSLSGGFANDFLHGGAGSNTLSGGAGADTFIFTKPSTEETIILDFDAAEHDLIDLGSALAGSSTLLSDYVRINRSGADALIEVSASGTGSGFNDLVIRLKDSPLQNNDLAKLYYGGNLEAGAIELPPRISIVASQSMASENGPTEGTFRLSREGNATGALVVHLSITGNATNGSDYQTLGSLVNFPAGSNSLMIRLRPYVDTTFELNEMVRLEIQSSTNYLVGPDSSAEITIEDLKPQLSLEVLEGLASVDGNEPGALLMRRAGLLSSEVFVQFTLGGTATNNVDYERVASYLSLAPGQTTKLIEITPKSGVQFGTTEAKIVRMTLSPDPSFIVSPDPAQVLIVPRKLDFASWQVENNTLDTSSDALLKAYAFTPEGSSASGPQTMARLPQPSLEDGHLVLRFRKKPGITDMIYQVEYSRNLSTWLAGADAVEDITSQLAPDDPGAAIYRAKEPMSAADAAAMRVRLVMPEDK